MQLFEGIETCEGSPASLQFTSMVVEKFSISNRGEELAAKLETAPLNFKKLAFTSTIASDIYVQYPAGLKMMAEVPADLRQSVEMDVLRNLTIIRREDALDFALNHAPSLTTADGEIAHVFNDAWFFQNQEEVSTKIRDAPPSGSRDLIIAEMVRALSEKKLSQEARAWAGAISDAELRKTVEARFGEKP